MSSDLKSLRELRYLLAEARDALIDAKQYIEDDKTSNRLEQLIAPVGKLAGEAELTYLRALEAKCKKLEEFA